MQFFSLYLSKHTCSSNDKRGKKESFGWTIEITTKNIGVENDAGFIAQ